MLSNAGLGRQYWAEAVMYACHLHNRLPSATLERMIMIPCTYSGMKGYCLWCLDSKKVVLNRDVTFNELNVLKLKVQVPDNNNGTPQRWSLKLLWFFRC